MGNGYSMKAQGTEADVYIYEDVGASWFGGVSAKQFAIDLKALGAVDTINVHINSFGGEVFEGVAIYQQLVAHPAKIIVYIDGVAASIASVIAMAGDEIRIAEAGFIMIHEAAGGCFGRAQEMRQLADLLDTITGTICDVYEARTQQDGGAIRDWMAQEKWFTAAEAVELLFADSIVDNMRVAAHGTLDVSRHGFRHAPQALLTPANAVPVQFPEVAAPVIVRPAALLTPPRDVKPVSSPLSARVALQAAQLAARKSFAA